MHNYKELKVWQKSRESVKEIYVVSASFPKEEKYGIISQIRRATISISLNIAEGAGRNSNKDFCHFLDMAFGSALEVETLIILCLDLDLLTDETHEMLLAKTTEIQKMIKGLADKFRNG